MRPGAYDLAVHVSAVLGVVMQRLAMRAMMEAY